MITGSGSKSSIPEEAGGTKSHLSSVSPSDFYPQFSSLQEEINARGFLVVSVFKSSAEPARINLSSLSSHQGISLHELIHHDGSEFANQVSQHAQPIYWKSDFNEENSLLNLPNPAQRVYISEFPFSGIAFPAHLGRHHSKVAIFIEPAEVISGVTLLNTHRESLYLLKKILKSEMSPRQYADVITPKEQKCLNLAGNGLTSDDIATKMDLSVHTVNAHLGSAISKLDCVNRIQAVAKAIRVGLIE